LVQVQIDAVIGDPVLWKVVGANAVAAIPGSNQGTALLGSFTVQRLLLTFVQAAAQDAHGPVEVLVLAALVLALDFQLFGRAALVPDAHGAFRLVDMLSAGASRPHAFPFDVLIANLDLRLIGLGQDRHGSRRGVDAPLLLCLGNPLDAMAAALVAQVPEN